MSYLFDRGSFGKGDGLPNEGAQLDRKSTIHWHKPSDFTGIMQPKPEGLCEPVVERLVRFADVLGEDWDDGHLSHLLHHPGKPAPGPPHQLVHVVPHLGLVGASGGQTHQVTLLQQGDQRLLAASLTLQMVQMTFSPYLTALS